MTLLISLLGRRLGDDLLLVVQGPVQMGERGLPQPDLAVVHRDAFADGSHPEPHQTLLVIEVSASSLRYDRKVKLPLYARYGYPEAWIADLVGEAIECHSGPSATGYRLMCRAGRAETVAPEALPGLALRVDEFVGHPRAPDGANDVAR